MMKAGDIQALGRLPLRRAEVLVMSIACMCMFRVHLPAAAALVSNPQHAFLTNSLSAAFRAPQLRSGTKLHTKLYNNADDFASFSEGQGDDDGQLLAKEFYEELEYRQHKISDFELKEIDETYTIRDNGEKGQAKDEGKNTIRTVSIRANRNASSSPGGRQVFANQRAQASSSPSNQDSPIFSLFSFLSPPEPRAATSAGLFSGSGSTVYSSGRSIRAEIEILESTMKNNEQQNNKRVGWEGIYVSNPEQLEEVLRMLAFSLVVASAAYIAIEASGGLAVIPFDEASASFDHVMSLVSDASNDGMSSVMVSVSNGDVFMGEETAWLVKESSGLATSVVEAVRSVEELALC